MLVPSFLAAFLLFGSGSASIAAAQATWQYDVPPPTALDGRAPFVARAPTSIGPHMVDQAAFSAPRPRQTYFDVDARGAIWVRGVTYKARFDARGAMYVPFLGSDAPRNYPVTFALARATTGGIDVALTPAVGAVRDGERVTIDRGPIDEVYEVGLESLEQTFMVAAPLGEGDLVLRIAVDTEFARSQTSEQLQFRNERGGVSYGRASIRERDGSLTALVTRLDGDDIEIVVPAARLASAVYPLVVDPVVSTFDVDASTSFDDYYPDVAYDLTNDRYLFVYQDAFSAGDFDVYSRLFTSAGALVTGGYVDSTTETWFIPHVANLGVDDTFLVVATTGDIASSTNRHIEGRITSATGIAYGAAFDISGALTDYNLYADVGGDPYTSTGGSYYCVGWQRRVGGLDQTVYRLVTGAGVLIGANPTLLQQSTGVKDVNISNGNAELRWNIVWDRCPSSAFECDIYGAQVHWDGALDTAAFQISNVSLDNYSPSVSSPRPDGTYMVVWRLDLTSHTDIESAIVSGSTVLVRNNLTVLEGTSVSERQTIPDIDTDGVQFVVGFSETVGGSASNYNAYVSAFAYLGGAVGLAEGHRTLAATTAIEDAVKVCAEASSGASTPRFVLTWDEETSAAAQSDIAGALYDTPTAGAKVPFCFGDGSGTACPCGNSGAVGRGCAHSTNPSGALLSASGSATVSADTVLLSASAMPSTATCLFFQGSAASGGGSGTVFGDGLRCATGTIIRLGTKTASSGAASYPTGADPDVSVRGLIPAAGAIRFYQCWFRNAAAFCTVSTFNLTNGMRITWLP